MRMFKKGGTASVFPPPVGKAVMIVDCIYSQKSPGNVRGKNGNIADYLNLITLINSEAVIFKSPSTLLTV